MVGRAALSALFATAVFPEIELGVQLALPPLAGMVGHDRGASSTVRAPAPRRRDEPLDEEVFLLFYHPSSQSPRGHVALGWMEASDGSPTHRRRFVYSQNVDGFRRETAEREVELWSDTEPSASYRIAVSLREKVLLQAQFRGLIDNPAAPRWNLLSNNCAQVAAGALRTGLGLELPVNAATPVELESTLLGDSPVNGFRRLVGGSTEARSSRPVTVDRNVFVGNAPAARHARTPEPLLSRLVERPNVLSLLARAVRWVYGAVGH